MDQLFEGAASVSIQGKRVLRFIDLTGYEAVYEIIGFEEVPVRLIDRRAEGIQAIQTLLETGEINDFASSFNAPAFVRIIQDNTGEVIIELEDTSITSNFILWIAIGLDDTIPVYETLYENILPLENNTYAVISLYQFSSSETPAASTKDSSSAASISSLRIWAG